MDKKNTVKEYVLAVDVGGTKVMVGYVDEYGDVIAKQRYAMNRSTQENAIDCIITAIEDFKSGHKGDPLAIGVGLVGNVDFKTGIWIGAMNIPISSPVNLSKILYETYKVPVWLDNDVHAATMAEISLGAGKKHDDFIYINVGTGISAGIVCNSQLIRGIGNYAGECGHMFVECKGEPCKCGRSGCLEAIASGGGMIEVAKRLMNDYPESSLCSYAARNQLFSAAIFSEADAGDELAGIIAERVVAALGTAVVNLVNLINPEAVIFGGGVMNDRWLLHRISDYVDKYALAVTKKYINEIALSKLEDSHLGLLGASAIAWGNLHDLRRDK